MKESRIYIGVWTQQAGALVAVKLIATSDLSNVKLSRDQTEFRCVGQSNPINSNTFSEA
jgi:hypothetical protein